MTTCFVVQGFGKKTDFTDGRVLDLDASYAVIKEAVEGAGLQCIRADEIQHSGTIDLPMYQHLLQADLVIADLSTYNVNAAFELGVRYGLRPYATIIVAEEGFKNPFDVGHIVIRRYKHLGEDIGTKEAKRFRDELKQAISEILAVPRTDSPIYTFMHWLSPPQDGRIRDPGIEMSFVALTNRDDSPTTKALLEVALSKINPSEGQPSDFMGASVLLEEVRKQRPNDSFVIQQLGLATYKAKHPTPEAALLKAKDILKELSPSTTNDPETLGLWGAIHKRLWELKHQDPDLGESITAYERGFNLKQDYYNGINLAYLLDLRALNMLKAGQHDEATADTVLARRTRRDVIRYAEPILANDMADDKRYWVLATLWEAAAGLDDVAAAKRWEEQARALQVPAWMFESTENQLHTLQTVLVQIKLLTG